MTDKLGFLYLALGLTSYVLYSCTLFSQISAMIKLGDADEEPEFKTSSWAAMLFLWW